MLQRHVKINPMQCNNVPHTGADYYFAHPHEQLKVKQFLELIKGAK